MAPSGDARTLESRNRVIISILRDLSVYYGPDFTDVTPVGLGHPFKVTFTSAPDLSGTYENVAGSGSVSGFERPGQLVMTYSGADGMSHGVAILQDIQTHLSSNNVEHDYVGAVLVHACYKADTQQCDAAKSRNINSAGRFCRKTGNPTRILPSRVTRRTMFGFSERSEAEA